MEDGSAVAREPSLMACITASSSEEDVRGRGAASGTSRETASEAGVGVAPGEAWSLAAESRSRSTVGSRRSSPSGPRTARMAPREARSLSTIDAAARAVHARAFQRKIELLFKYKNYMSAEGKHELLGTLKEVAGWCRQMVEKIEE